MAENQAILVVSFGTSYNHSRKAAIEAIEQTIAERFPEFRQYRAFTSPTIRKKLKARDGLEIDSVEQALARAQADGVTVLAVQPTYLMGGFEFRDLSAAVNAAKDKFKRIVLARPLLSQEDDYLAVVRAITDAIASDDKFHDNEETAICFMGHGTGAAANEVYPKLQKTLEDNGFSRWFIGTVEAQPTLEDLIRAMKAKGNYRRVVLEPLMVVAGEHANHDMAGAHKDSWKSILEAEGYQVECILRGLGEIASIREIYAEHTRAAVNLCINNFYLHLERNDEHYAGIKSQKR